MEKQAESEMCVRMVRPRVYPTRKEAEAVAQSLRERPHVARAIAERSWRPLAPGWIVSFIAADKPESWPLEMYIGADDQVHTYRYPCAPTLGEFVQALCDPGSPIEELTTNTHGG